MMNNTEIKKAWEVMKKEIKKEIGISGGFTMNKKQIKNRTATFLICNEIPYEEEIGMARKSIENVMGYESWTDEEKEKSKAYHEGLIEAYEEKMKKYGTKENEALTVANEITNSNAFKKFAKNFGSVVTVIEKKDICIYLRFNY